MRHIRVRRRFKLALMFLFIICLVAFFESSIEAFAPQLKNFAAFEIENALGKRIGISIGSVDGGIIRPLSLNDIKITDLRKAPFFASIEIAGIKTNYRIWDLFFTRPSSSLISSLFYRDSHIDVDFTAKDGRFSGFIRIEKDKESLNIKGYLKPANFDRIDFSGSIKEDSFQVEARPSRGILNINGTVSGEDILTINFKAYHLYLNGFDVTCEAILMNKIAMLPDDSKKNYMEGEFEIKSIILNYKPFMNIRALYKIINGILDVSSMNIGNSFNAWGKVSLKNPHKIDISLTANNVSISWLMLTLGANPASAIISGTMNAKLGLKGTPNNMKSNMHLEIKEGTLAEKQFDFLSANLKGDGPIFRIEDAKISRQSGYFTLTGEMDLRRMGHNNFFGGLKISSDDRAVTWDEWDVKKMKDTQELRMVKKLNEELNVDFKKFIAEQKVDESFEHKDEVGLEYKIHSNDSLKMTVGQDNNFFGLEHRDSF